MPSKSILPRGFKAEFERIAERYRTELGISKFDPLDAFKLAEHLDVPIFSVDEAFSGNLDHPRYLFMSDINRFSAMWMPNEDGEKIIIHNTNHSKYRQQSNLMHELAHIIRNHEIPEESARLCAQLNLIYYNALHEQEAKHLGGCLQITTPGIRWAFKHYNTVEEISEYYCASIDMVNYRLGVTGTRKVYSYQQR